MSPHLVGLASLHRFVFLLRGESSWSLSDDTHEPCGSTGRKPIPAAFSHVLPCFSGGLTGRDVSPCCHVSNVGYLVEGAKKNATVGECRDQAEERRASVRGVRGIPLVCGLEDLSEAAVLHRVQCLDRVEMFGEKRAGAGRLLCVGDLEGLRQGHQTLDRFVVGFADLLGLVGVHRLEDLAKCCVGRCVCVVCVGHVCVSVSEKGLNRLRDDTHEPCGWRKLKPSLRGFQQESECFSGTRHFAQNAPRRVSVWAWPLLVTYTIRPHGDVKLAPSCQSCERRTSVFGASSSCGLCRAVVLAGEVEELGFDRLPFRFGFAGDLSVHLVSKGTLVPTFGPSESVEQSVKFCFAKAGTRAIPATLSSFFLDVIPFAAAFGIEGEFNQTQNHHQVSDHLGLVERSTEGSEFDSILAAGQVGQVQQVVAIRFASALGVVFVSVLFDSLGVHHLFAFAGSGRSVDRSFVVADQGNQSCQGCRVSVPANRYVQAAAGIYLATASVDLVDRVLDLSYAFSPFEYWAYKFASFARVVFGSDTSVAFCFPSGWQPRYLVSAVVGSDRCVVGTGEGCFEFDSESDFVCVHRSVPLWFEVCFASRFLRRDDTHEPCVSRNIQPVPACFFSNSACFLGGHRCPNITPPSRSNMFRITRRTCC